MMFRKWTIQIAACFSIIALTSGSLPGQVVRQSGPVSSKPAPLAVRQVNGSGDAYFGALNERIDAQTGSLFYGLHLIAASPGSGFNLGLVYTSDLWRSGAGKIPGAAADVGFGFGWTLTPGAVYPTASSYVFVDSSGSRHELQGGSSGQLTSNDGQFSFNPQTNSLQSMDGSVWQMTAVSSSGEPDAGAQYPTLIRTRNGSVIHIQYAAGAGAGHANSSARITSIDDSSLQRAGSASAAYVFSYNQDSPVPHLKNITNAVGSKETYALGFSSGQKLVSPLGTTNTSVAGQALQSVTRADGAEWTFAYDLTGSGELTRATTSAGTYVGWHYRTFTFANGVSAREVDLRSSGRTAGAATSFAFIRNDSADSGLSVHSGLTVRSNSGSRTWTFATAGPAWQVGLPLSDTVTTNSHSSFYSQTYSWALTSSGQPFISDRVVRTSYLRGAKGRYSASSSFHTQEAANGTLLEQHSDLTAAPRVTPDSCGSGGAPDGGPTQDDVMLYLPTTEQCVVTAQFIPVPYDYSPVGNIDPSLQVTICGDFYCINGVNTNVALDPHMMDTSDLGANIFLGSAVIGIGGALLDGISTTVAEETTLEQLTAAKAAGDAGEQAVANALDLAKNTTQIPSLSGTASYRIPDFLDTTNNVLIEVKNYTSTLSYTEQLEDELMWVQSQSGWTMQLYIRSTTPLSGPLQQLINSGQIIPKIIPGT